MQGKKNNPYDDIIDMPNPEPRTHKRMSSINRAAQFAPFAALTGYDMEIKEAGRLTAERISLDEDKKNILDNKLMFAMEDRTKELSIKYFVPDEKKQGGNYTYATGWLKRIDNTTRSIIFEDGKQIAIDSIVDIEFVGV